LAIKKVGRISWIVGHRGKTGQRSENAARPFPAVADQIVHAESAGARRMRADGDWVPIRKIEITVLRGGRFISPRILTLESAVRCAIGSAMELLFVGQLAAEPICVSRGFGVTHVNRPIERQTQLFKHTACHPDISIAMPERGMLDCLRFFPSPTFAGPKRA